MKVVGWVAAFALGAAVPAFAGPPYQTDDPEPTELGHWEIYNFVTVDGRNSELDGEGGLDLNYGGAKGLQLTATLPIAFSRSRQSGWRAGSGDLELGAKYRFVNDEKRGWQAAIFPRAILPTSAKDLGGKRVRFLLPLWVQKDFGSTSLFGGGGYEINPGAANKDFWQASVAVTHDIGNTLSLGTEVTWRSADTRGGESSTGVDVGLIHKLGGPYSLLLAGGPNFSGGQTSYHSYAALALNF
ncbi:MAG: transporter [Sphingomicrobium sp.]